MLKISQKNDRNKGKHELFARRRHSDFSLKLYIHCLAAGKYFFFQTTLQKSLLLYYMKFQGQIPIGVVAIA